MQKTLKPYNFINEMHENEFKSFLKNICFQSRTSKTRSSHILPQNFQSNKYILYQNNRIYNLGWPNEIHTQFHVLSLAKNNL